MKKIGKTALALLAAAFLAAGSAIAADVPTPPTAPAKPDISGVLKDKAAKVVEDGKQQLGKSLGLEKPVNQNATQPATQEVEVTKETETIVTPEGAAQETTTVVTPVEPAPASK